MPKRVMSNRDLLRALCYLKPQYRTALLKVASDDGVIAICECIHNVLIGTIPLNDKYKGKLVRHKNILRKLTQKDKIENKKKIIIQHGESFLPIIIGSLLSSALGSLFK